MSAILIIALLFGGGVSLAAESALPGSILYPVKVSVNEGVRSAFATGENQVRWDMRRVERRIAEARELAEKGRLDAEVRANIETRMSAHTEDFEKNIEALSGKDDEVVFEIRSDFRESLREREREVSVTAEEHEDARTELYILLRVINSDIEDMERKFSESRDDILERGGAEMKVSAEGKLGAAENTLASLRAFVELKASSTSATNLLGAKMAIKIIEDIIVRGKADMSAGEFAQAFLTFHEAIRATADVRRSLELSVFDSREHEDDEDADNAMRLDIDADTDADVTIEGGDDDKEEDDDHSVSAGVNVDASVRLR